MNKITDKDKKKIIGLYQKKNSIQEIADKFNVNRKTICYHLIKAEIYTPKKSRIKTRTIKKPETLYGLEKEYKKKYKNLIQDYQKGMKLRNMIKKYNFGSQSAIYTILKKAGVKYRGKFKKGQKMVDEYNFYRYNPNSSIRKYLEKGQKEKDNKGKYKRVKEFKEETIHGKKYKINLGKNYEDYLKERGLTSNNK